MENSPNSHKFFPEEPISIEAISNTSALSIERLTQLTRPEITEIAAIIIETQRISSEEKVQLQKLWIEYAKRVEAYINSIEAPKARSAAQIAAIINKAFIFQQTGNTTRYLEELDDAEVYAANGGFNAVSTSLDVEIKSATESLELSPEKVVLKLRGIIDDANRAYLKDLMRDGADLEDIIGHAYGIILEEGKDPDEVLVMIGITEQ